MHTPEQATAIVSEQVTALHATVAAIMAQIDTLQDDLIEQYNTRHAEPFNGFCDEDTDEAQCVGTLGCIASDLSDAEECITRALELLGLV